MPSSPSVFDQTRQSQADLENRILKGIAAEWKMAIREATNRDDQAELPLRRPTFQLADMELLGTWERQSSTITLQRSFVLEHPWEAIIDVLKHETAHQIADQMLGASPQAMPHGSEFRAACRMLRISPRASGDYQRLHDCLQNGGGGESDRLLARIRKLLALAEGGEAYEAESALAKAQSLITRYHLDLLDVKRVREFYSIYLGKPTTRRDHVEGLLGGLLRDFYFVEVLWTTTWVVESECFGRALEITGTPENLRLAEYVYHFIRQFIDSSWERFRNHRRLGVRAKRDFGDGVIAGFRTRLKTERRTLQGERSDSRDLMLWRDPELHAFFRFRYPRLRKAGSSPRRQDAESYQAGHDEGSRLEIRAGLDGAAGNGPRLLTGPGKTIVS